ncbi:DNA polymerase III subunit alpha [uncultured Serinicoccus sp.]|uniref:DNA polymerase III subunit alpha n=1 Tax=uncultured Serinicoccus sp. TaxID=735514 RepID=UPI00261065A1|nr:DNA polymerase III subunit alpha [uncultured Serinicoccus sp.]
MSAPTSSSVRREQNFVHLHNHTEYSMLDGAARITDMFETAAELGMPAIATTDHGFIFGAYEFWKTAQRYDVKPIIGLEAYVTPGTHRTDKTRVKYGDGGRDDVSGGGAYTHMTLLARNNNGMHNLFRMASLASMEGYYFKPRMDRELLETYGQGLIATTGCPSGEIQTRLRLGQWDQAVQYASDMKDIFGADNYFLELMDHGIQIERVVRQDLLRLARELSLPLLATNDLHYTHQEDAKAHSALLCVQSGSTMQDPNRFQFNGDGYYLKSAAEMRDVWRELPEACDNTLLVADRCDISFTEGEGRYMPRFPVPEGEDETSWFIKEVETGLQRRYPEGVPDYARKQAEYESEVIIGKQYPGYFLVVADFINWAKKNGIKVGPGRGSGAGSMCAYAMGITDLDPIPHGLIFERFLNPERQSMPDFDVDFDDRRRSEVIRYVTEKYGDERVAMIVTYGTIKAKQALKDSSRVMGYPFAMGEKLTKAMPPSVMGKDISLAGIQDPQHKRYAEAGEFRELLAEDEHAAEVFDTATGLEGLKRQWGVHAAGVIMSSEPLIDVIPIMRRDQDGQIITQFDYPTCESLGLVKMDFLGLRNLTVLDDAITNIRDNRGQDIDLDALSKDMTDRATYDLLSRGDTLGVFQLDGNGMRQLLRLMQPDTFEDISAALALYRPGPMGVNAHTNFALRKNGKQENTPLDPELKGKLQPEMEAALQPILENTYGLCVAGETPIIDADTGERVRVDELEDRVRQGFFTLGVDERGKVVRRRVTHWWQMPDKPVLTVTTNSGQQLRLSADHPVLTARGWVEAGELRAGHDRIARPRDVFDYRTPSPVRPEEAALLGYLLSDGYITLHENSFISSSVELRAEVSQLCTTLFDDTFPVEECLDRTAARVRFAASPAGTGSGRNPRRGRFASIGINAWLRDLGFTTKTTSADKFIPEVLKRSDPLARRRLVAALWDGDGHVGAKLAYYKTISEQLARDVLEVLSSLGIPARLHEAGEYTSMRRGRQRVWTVHVFDERFWRLVTPLMVEQRKVAARADRQIASRSRGLNRQRMLEHASDVLREAPEVSARTKNSMGWGPASLAGLHRHLWRHGLVTEAKTSHPAEGEGGFYPLNATAEAYLEAMGTDEDRFYASMDWNRVVDVSVGEAEPVYDITVDDIHNFVSQGMVLSNCIYQEQVMEIAQKLAGYTLGNADLLRRAMGKKKKEVLDAEYIPFSDGMKANGYSEASVAALWGVLVPFSDYAFNKAHTAAYGVISYWTGYLKANYPAEYMAALLTSVGDDKDKTALYLAECRRLRIPVLPPDVNESIGTFAAVGDDIRFGLQAIRNVGANVVQAIVATREDKGAFTSFEDFLRKCPAVVCNKRTIESLCKAGAFDGLGHTRQGLVTVHERYVEALADEKKQEAIGQDSLFSGLSFGGDDDSEGEPLQIVTLPPIPGIEWDKTARLAFEREMLGLYVSDHPLNGIEHILSQHASASILQLIGEDGAKDGDFVTVAGLITNLQLKRTKNGDPYARASVEDMAGSLDVVFWPKTYMTISTMLAEDTVVVVKGRLKKDDSTELMANEMMLPDIKTGPRGPVVLTMTPTRINDVLAHQLKGVLANHPGATEVHVRLTQPGRTVLIKLDEGLRVTATPELFGDLKALLGPACVGS